MATFGSFTWASAASKSLGEYLGKMKTEPIATLEMKHSVKESTYKEIEDMVDKFVAELRLK